MIKQSLLNILTEFEKNYVKIKSSEVIRVLLATDVLSEGQNLQDSFIIVNYDLPWAIIRLIIRNYMIDKYRSFYN